MAKSRKQITEGTGGSFVHTRTDGGGAPGAAEHQTFVVGIDGSDSVVPADTGNGLDVDVTRLPALPAGTNNIGDVDVLSVPADPFGANADAAVTTDVAASMQAKLRGLIKILNDVWDDAGNQLRTSASVASSPPVKLSATPTISTTAYASGDTVGGLMTFSGAPVAGTIVQLTVQDKDAEQAALELWLFDASITPAADNAAHSISDGDMANCIGVIPLGPYYASALNAVSVNPMPGIAYDLDSGTSIFGLLVARSAPTYAGVNDLTVELVIQA